jgi:hypothetical protein
MGSDYHPNAMISALQEPGFRANLLHFRGSGRVVGNPEVVLKYTFIRQLARTLFGATTRRDKHSRNIMTASITSH